MVDVTEAIPEFVRACHVIQSLAVGVDIDLCDCSGECGEGAGLRINAGSERINIGTIAVDRSEKQIATLQGLSTVSIAVQG